MDIIQANWTPGKVKRIIEEEPTEEFYNRAFSKYDCVIEEAPLTTTQKQMALQKALYFREIGIPISSAYLLDKANLPDKKAIIEETIKQEQQAAQMQMAQQQAQTEQLNAANQMVVAEANSKNALAAERMNKIQLDMALSSERIQRAEEDKTGAMLNIIKAVKELDTMDLEQMLQKIQILQTMEGKVESNAAQTASVK
jgi:hypothetical protein